MKNAWKRAVRPQQVRELGGGCVRALHIIRVQEGGGREGKGFCSLYEARKRRSWNRLDRAQHSLRTLNFWIQFVSKEKKKKKKKRPSHSLPY